MPTAAGSGATQIHAPRIVIIGAGISGLAAAWRLANCAPGADILVLEASAHVGGKLRLAPLAGIEVDVGAEALLARRPEGTELIASLGLGARVVQPQTLAAKVWAGGVARPLPARTQMGIPGDLQALRASGVLSPDAVAVVEAELTAPPMPPLAADVSVGSIVRERLGAEVLERLVEPLLGGVYAGRADELSVAATIPALAARLRRDGGSLVAAARSVSGGGAPASGDNPVFVSLSGGLATIVTGLSTALTGRGVQIRTGTTVNSIRRTPSGFAVDCVCADSDGVDRSLVTADAVILATPAAKTATLLIDVAPAAATELAAIEAASMAIVSLAFEGIELPTGSGLLVGSREGLAVKALTLSSRKWPGTPAGLSVLRASVGRAGQTHDLQRSDPELVELVCGELVDLVGVRVVPVDSVVTRWGGGLPQYAVGHVDRVRRIRDAVARVPGLAVCGATYDGLGLPACIASAHHAVDQLLADSPAIATVAPTAAVRDPQRGDTG